MLSDYKPIIRIFPKEQETVEIYFAHDIHKGSEQHDENKWKMFKKDILAEPNRYVVFVGDCFENTIVGSKGDIYRQQWQPQQQKEWFAEELSNLGNRVLAIVPGNHEARTARVVGLYPLYDCALVAGMEDRYRHHFAFLHLGVGHTGHGKNRPCGFTGYITHRMKDIKSVNGADYIDGIDFAAFGHDHEPKDKPRAKLVYDSRNKTAYVKSVEVLNSGAFLSYGGYAVDSGYRPNSDKVYKLILDSSERNKKKLRTVGFYV